MKASKKALKQVVNVGVNPKEFKANALKAANLLKNANLLKYSDYCDIDLRGTALEDLQEKNTLN